jgi:hypothetical protein
VTLCDFKKLNALIDVLIKYLFSHYHQPSDYGKIHAVSNLFVKFWFGSSVIIQTYHILFGASASLLALEIVRMIKSN